jgi:hypothetical protein
MNLPNAFAADFLLSPTGCTVAGSYQRYLISLLVIKIS